jgi:hypothetical protein
MRSPDFSNLRLSHDIGFVALAASRIPPASRYGVLAVVLHRARDQMVWIDAARRIASMTSNLTGG